MATVGVKGLCYDHVQFLCFLVANRAGVRLVRKLPNQTKKHDAISMRYSLSTEDILLRSVNFVGKSHFSVSRTMVLKYFCGNRPLGQIRSGPFHFFT